MIYVLWDVTNDKEVSRHTSMDDAIKGKHEWAMLSEPGSAMTWKIKDEDTGALRDMTMEEYKAIMKYEYSDDGQ